MKNRSLRTTYVTLAAGAIVGALAMATVFKTDVVTSAVAGPQVSVKNVGNINNADMEALRQLDSSFASLAEFIEPSVVHIRSESKTSKDMMGRAMPSGGEGSGVIFRPDGWIVTNDHVVNGFDKVTVVLADGREFPGTVKRAEDSDLAVIKIDSKNLPAATFADSSKVRPGQFAIAMGAPFGLENSITIGHVSALGRNSMVPDSKVGAMERFYTDLIQTDAAINQGNSGGPLLNVDGQVIGINTAIYSGTGGNVGIGFAIPANQARLIADMLIEKGKISRGFLGLVPVNLKPYQKTEMKIEGGALVDEVPNNSPAGIAGLKKGDVITKVGSLQIRSQIDVRNAMLKYAPGEKVSVQVLRDGQTKSVDVTIGTPPKPVAQGQNNPNFKQFEMPDLPNGFGDLLPKGFGNDDNGSQETPAREDKARLGVNVSDVDESARKQYDIPADVAGAVVTGIEPGSVASKIGLQVGDVIKQVGDKQVRTGADLVKAMESVKWGDSKTVAWAHFGKNSTFEQSRTVLFK